MLSFFPFFLFKNILSPLNFTVMKYYIIDQYDNGKLEIIKVLPVDEVNFLEDYGKYVLAVGNTMAEALQSFGKTSNSCGSEGY
jgi:hypothetical protein